MKNIAVRLESAPLGVLQHLEEQLLDVRAASIRPEAQAAVDAVNRLSYGAETRTRPVARGVTLDNVERCFQYQPWNLTQQEQGTRVREALLAAARTILREVPDSPDRSSALRKLREARMDCNSALTFDGEF